MTPAISCPGTRGYWSPGKRPSLVNDVAVADAAGLDLDPHRRGAGLRHVALDELERAARRRHLYRTHLRHDVSYSGFLSNVSLLFGR